MVDAKEYLIPDIQLDGFIIKILDEQQKPANGLGFSVIVDGIGMSIMTNEEGIIKP
jgi:hypothetical protein